MEDDDLRSQIGHLRGRVEGVEGWLGRLDGNISQALATLHNKLDRLADQVASNSGSNRVVGYIWTGGGGVAIGYVVLHALGVH